MKNINTAFVVAGGGGRLKTFETNDMKVVDTKISNRYKYEEASGNTCESSSRTYWYGD